MKILNRFSLFLFIFFVFLAPHALAQADEGELSLTGENSVYNNYYGFSGFDFTGDGSKIVSSSWDGFLGQHSLSQNWDVGSTESTYQRSMDHRIEDIVMQPDGSHVYTLSGNYPDPPWNQDQLIKWELTSDGDISTMPSDLESSDRMEMVPMKGRALYIGNSGDRLYLLDYNYNVTQYSMNSWDIGTLSETGSFSLDQSDGPGDLWFSADGSTMYVLLGYHASDVTPTVRQYALSTPWDVKTASQVADITIPSATDSVMAFGFSDDSSTMGLLGLEDGGYFNAYDFTPAEAGDDGSIEIIHISEEFYCGSTGGEWGSIEYCDVNATIQNTKSTSQTVEPSVRLYRNGDIHRTLSEEARTIPAGQAKEIRLGQVLKEDSINCDDPENPTDCEIVTLDEKIDVLAGNDECTNPDRSTPTACESDINLDPVIDSFTGPDTLDVGESGTFTVSVTDPNDDAMTFDWDWDSDGTFEITDDPLTQRQKSFSSEGDYSVTVQVEDGEGGSSTDTVTVTVGEADGDDDDGTNTTLTPGCESVGGPGAITPFYPLDCPLNMSGQYLFDSEGAVTVNDSLAIGPDPLPAWANAGVTGDGNQKVVVTSDENDEGFVQTEYTLNLPNVDTGITTSSLKLQYHNNGIGSTYWRVYDAAGNWYNPIDIGSDRGMTLNGVSNGEEFGPVEIGTELGINTDQDPAAALDVNGNAIIQDTLNMSGGTIRGVSTGASDPDDTAASKGYVDDHAGSDVAGQSCSDGKYVTGFDSSGDIICEQVSTEENTCDEGSCSWVDQSCGGGSCSSDQMQQEYVCSDDSCEDGQTQCVTDSQCTDDDEIQDPIARFELNKSNPEEGDIVRMDASSSVDPDGDTLKYDFEVTRPNEGGKELGTVGPVPESSPGAFSDPITLDEEGSYEFTLNVQNGENGNGGLDSVTKQITVSFPDVNQDPVACLFGCNAGTVEAGMQEGESYWVEARDSYDPDGDIESFSWNVVGNDIGSFEDRYEWDNGMEEANFVVPEGEVDLDRTVEIEVTVTDDDGATDTEGNMYIEINNQN